MAIKFYSSISTYHCPKCHTILAKRKYDESLYFLYVLLFIPIGLIALIIHLIRRKTREYNTIGEEIIHCPNCHSIIAIYNNGIMGGSCRIIYQENELLKMMMPTIKFLNDNYDIICDKYINKEKYSELLILLFKNSSKNKKYIVYISGLGGKLQMSFDGNELEQLNMKKLTINIIDSLT